MSSENLLAKSLYHSDAAELFLLPQYQFLKLTWNAKVPSLIIQEVYEHLLREMNSRQIKHILIDVSQRGRATPADETWMMQEFVPRLLHLFKDGIHLAYLLDSQHYQELKNESPNGSMESLSQLISMNYCRNEEKALNWLRAKKIGQPV